MKTSNFKKTQLAKSLSIILGATAITPVFAAQENETDNIEVIEVTGIRSSMIKSMDIKRSSQGIVDAINAEDIGKFPDSNLAESLQRITGISIERSNGEGSKVSARGFGPNRNLVTLNGRQLPTTTGERSFDFANLAAEGVSGVQVYKTSKADVPTGGIGATINISTHKPLDNPGQKAVFSLEALDDKSTKKGSATPQLSGLYSNTSDDGKFGVSISGSYSERESGSQQGKTAFWRSFAGIQDTDWSGPNAAWGGVAKDASQTNRPGDDDIYSVPQNTIYKFEEQQRKRSNAQLVLQYKPIDSVTATLDYTYVKKENDTQFNDISVWYNFGPSENTWSDGPISSPLIYSETFDPNNPTDLAMGGADYSVKDETKSLGLNIEWQVNDSLAMRLDHHDSSAQSDPNSPLGSSNLIGMAAFVRTASATDYSGDIPMLSVTGGNSVQASDMIVTGSVFTNAKNRADVEQTQLHGNYVFEEAGSIDFGIALTSSENRRRVKNVQRNNWGGEGTAGSFDESLFPRESIHDQFDNLSGGNFDGFNGDVEILENYFAFDFNGVRERAVDVLSVQAAALGDCGNSFCPSSDYASETDQYTKEEMQSVYFQYNYDGEIGDMPFDVHVGIRYEETDVTSSSAVPGFTAEPRWEGTSEVSLLSSGAIVYGTQEASYDHTLPSINFNLEVTDDIILRAAFSETIGRPQYTSMIGGTKLNAGSRVGGGTGSTGNAGLLPLESKNFDLSAEWYYEEGSYVSLGYFTKDVKNDILTTTINTTTDIVNPADGPYVAEARAAVGNDGLAQRQYIFDTYGATDPEHVFMDNGNIIILGNAATDNLMNFGIDTPQNVSGKTGYDGIEFAVQHLFGDSGFGGIVNYTKTDTDNEHNDFLLDSQVAELGISDSANVVGFYEKDGLSVRVAYNWRDKFIVALVQDGGAGPGPRYIEDYAQVDMTVSYDVPQVEGLNIFFNAINITEENARTSGRDERQVLDSIQQGARYSLGARYTF
ncbi:MAG: TonB-dependent receptor [Thalassotalea sp.]|nr:TonB-dependent receptor [Thalassotalea sp.]